MLMRGALKRLDIASVPLLTAFTFCFGDHSDVTAVDAAVVKLAAAEKHMLQVL